MPDPQTGGQADLRGQSQTCALEKRELDPYFPVRAQCFSIFFEKWVCYTFIRTKYHL